MVIDESPSALSSLAVMQMDDDLPVHLNVYISMFKQWWHVKKYKNILLVLLQDLMVMHKFSYWHGGHRRISWWRYTAW